ncbi:alpha/beta fold hydrolase [Pacificibacter marinus]|uniref:alpha/beta fold hydrolase n=1 Tax=Pacificibacter marinus TaxID=658057 RepID=UPI001C07C077|nr:alpha/beta hydrolase [Pacificibacter marinus]MBU2867255.1 alpha/beta hydrolase [Pacificibacter marinus]
MNPVPQLMVLHGLGATTDQFSGMFDAHFQNSPIAMNMPGHGERPRENGRASFDRFAALALDTLDQLKVESVTLAGISMGAGIAIKMALQRPDLVNGLILLRPAWMDEPNPKNLKIIHDIGVWLSQGTKLDAIDRLNKDRFYHDLTLTNPAAAKSILGAITRSNSRKNAPVLTQMVEDTPLASLADLAAIGAKTLVVATPDDPLHPREIAQAWADQIPSATLCELPSKYVAPAAFQSGLNAALDTFLRP